MFSSSLFCSKDGWLHRLGMVDQAGGGPVHLLGAVTGLVATMILKPRLGRYNDSEVKGRMACPTNALLGMFLLWLEHISYFIKGAKSGMNYGVADSGHSTVF